MKIRTALLSIFLFSALTCTDLSAQFNKNYFFWKSRTDMVENNFRGAIQTLNMLLRTDDSLHEAYFLRGVAKYNLGDFIGAEHDFTIAIGKNPVYTMAYNARAITRMQIGNYDDALNDFREAIELRPDLPGPYYSRAITYLQNKQYDKAIEDLDKYVLQEGRVIEAYLARGEAYLNLGDTVRAFQEYDRGIKTNYYSPAGYFSRGRLHAVQNDHDMALADFNTAVERDSAYIPGLFSRAILYDDMDRPMQALADMDRVIEIDTTYMLAYFNRAIMRSNIGDLNRAMEDYDRVAMYNPNNVLVYYNRAGLYYQLGDLRAAVNDYSRAIELYPDFANAYLYRSQLRYLLRDDRGAESDKRFAETKIAEYRSKLSDTTFSIYADTTRNFSRLLAFDTQFARGEIADAATVDRRANLRASYRFTLAYTDGGTPTTPRHYSREQELFISETGNPLMRFTAWESTISPDSLIMLDRQAEHKTAENQDWIAIFERAVTQGMIKQYTNSVNYYTAAIEKNPSNPFLYMNRSVTRTEMIDFISSMDNQFQRVSVDMDPSNQMRTTTSQTYSYDEPVSDLNKAAKLMPEYPYIYYNRGNLFVKSGQLPDAYDDFTRAIELYPNFAEAYFNRGLVQIYMKDTRKGLLDLSKAGELGIREAYELLKLYSGME